MNALQRHYLRLLWQHKGLSLLGVALAVLTAFAGIALLAVSGWFISAAALAGLSVATAQVFNFFTPGALVRGLSIARTAGRYGERLISHEATFRVISRLRADVFRLLAQRHWVERPLDRHATGSRLLQDIQHIESIYLAALLPATVVLAVSLGYLGVLALVLPVALLPASLLLLALVVLMPWLYSRRVLQPQDALHQRRVLQWQTASSLFSSLRTLTLHQRLEATGAQLCAQARQADEQETAAVNRQQRVLLGSQSLLVGLTLLVLVQGMAAFGRAELAGANLFMLLLLTLGSAEVLLSASPVAAALQLGWRALQRLGQTAPEAAADWQDTRDWQAAPQPQVQITALTYRYPAQPQAVLDNVSLQLQGPGWYWMTGASGRGKSTLLALLAGQLQAPAGTIRWGAAVATPPALMPQRLDILRASLRDNLSLYGGHTDDALWAALRLVELDGWAQQLPQGLETWLGEGEWQPSGGEVKRLGLARLVLQDAPVLLLDEPAAGMDEALAQRVFARLAQHWADRLVLANTHDTGLIQPGQTVLAL